MPAFLPVLGAVATAIAAALYALSGTTRYVPHACANVASFLPAHVVGQDLAINQLVDAVCEHVLPDSQRGHTPGGGGPGAHGGGRRPLIVSVHGPPGVGKTFTHTLLARALYNRAPEAAVDCPGEHCRGAKVLYGMSYVEAERSSQLAAVRHAVLEHLRHAPNPLLVVEEYDKLDCDSRALLRQLVAHPEIANATSSRAIILLESNLGFLELEQMLTEAGGDKTAISPEAAEARLRDVVLSAWRRGSAARGKGAAQGGAPPFVPCESLEDSVAFASTIDFFLPFFPLTRPEVRTLMEVELGRYGSRLTGLGAALEWGQPAVEWLVERVDFAGGPYPVEGAKQVSTVCVKHVSRLVRRLQEQLRAGAFKHAAAVAQGQAGHKPQGAHQPQLVFRIEVAQGGRELQVVRA